jgi:hypothetical protein
MQRMKLNTIPFKALLDNNLFKLLMPLSYGLDQSINGFVDPVSFPKPSGVLI